MPLRFVLWFLLTAAPAVASSRGQPPEWREAACEGAYPHHLQGVSSNGSDALYWSWTDCLVKTDLSGRLLQRVPADNHHGDLCHHDGRLYVAVNLGRFNLPAGKADSHIYVYDADSLRLLDRQPVPEVVHGAGGIACDGKRFLVVGGLPEGEQENCLYEYDLDLKFVRRHVLASGYTRLGIQTAEWDGQSWWFGCYGSPEVVLRADSRLQFAGRQEFRAAVGLLHAGDGRFLVARDRFAEDAGHTARLQFASVSGGSLSLSPPPDRPGIVFILCDDLGYGDLSCLNPDGRIPTPNLDRLAREGVVFTDAHSPSAVCTPSRYGLMTGRYGWRSRLQKGVLGGLSPRLIEPGRLTVASMLRKQGYRTACIGKWHLGMDWALHPGVTVSELDIESRAQVFSADFTKPVTNGPNAVGFDYYFGISASLDMVPYTFLENDRVTALPVEDRGLLMFAGDAAGRHSRQGPAAPGFDGSGVLPALTDRAIRWLSDGASGPEAGRPFFLYLAYASPHTPILPAPEWRGKSGLNSYADFVMQQDHEIGRLLDVIDRSGFRENTLVIFASDNGCSPEARFDELTAKGHNPSGPFRGHKADIYEGGHRVPFLVRWPARVPGGRTTAWLTCLTDFMATAARVAGASIPDDAAEDSFSFLPALTGEPAGAVRTSIVHHSITGNFAIREGRWKLALCPGSGGWSQPRPGSEPAGAPPVQLFDLESDPGESRNVQDAHPEVVAALLRKLEEMVENGRSTPGPPSRNTVPVDIRKGVLLR